MGTAILSLLGGLALFMYGMQMMTTIWKVAGNRMKQILEPDRQSFSGVLAGSGYNGPGSSPPATTVMTVGFVNSGPDDLKTGRGLLAMGANVGTTIIIISGQLIALDIGAPHALNRLRARIQAILYYAGVTRGESWPESACCLSAWA